MRSILVTNDDGVSSDGIHALAEALKGLGTVTVVAPTQEASAIGHALTLRRPLRIEHHREGVYAVDGTPTDCVNLGVDVILQRKPDLVVSGINKGWNIGDDVTYSGTVAGALEGALLGIPSIAVSLQRTPEYDFSYAANAAAQVAAQVLKDGLSPRSFLNINAPSGAPKGLRVTTQARRNHVTKIAKRVDPRGQPYYWIEEALDDWHKDSGRSDYEAVMEGYISVTPLQTDLTDHDGIGGVERLVGRASR
jgi:5'-nucleotidase